LNDGSSSDDQVWHRHVVGAMLETKPLPLRQLRNVVQLQLVSLMSEKQQLSSKSIEKILKAIDDFYSTYLIKNVNVKTKTD
jgi:hypothetical protein